MNQTVQEVRSRMPSNYWQGLLLYGRNASTSQRQFAYMLSMLGFGGRARPIWEYCGRKWQ